ncbi:MAG: NlpC/P60 family protein [Bacillota bacterium]
MRRKVSYIGRTTLLVCFFLLCSGLTAYAAFGDYALKYGTAGEDVAILQNKLSALGYDIKVIDGKFGRETLQAVRAFQADNQLESDGIVGGQTFQCLLSGRTAPSADQASRGYTINPRSKGAQIALMAQQFLHVPYAWAGSSPGGFDCSGFIYYLYGQQGITVPRMADAQYQTGQRVEGNDLQLGDLVFFETYEPGPSHVGVYIGGGNFIHASSAAGEVTVTPLSKPYYAARYLGARRVTR